MSASNAVPEEIVEGWGTAPPADSIAPSDDVRPAAVLRGGARGLEIVVDGRSTSDAIAVAVSARLAEAPGFFRGSDVRIRVDSGPLAFGCLSKLDAIANQFELKIVEIGALEAVPLPNLAAGSAPAPATKGDESAPEEAGKPVMLAESDPAQGSLPLPETEQAPTRVELPQAQPAPASHAPTADQLELALQAIATANLEPEIEVIQGTLAKVSPDTRVVVGPIRSGVILEHRGHLIVFGDVNPGAEIRAEGNIVVLGRLRGTAHAGINREAGFILALRLEPQQLRIGRMVARASEGDTPGSVPELAHVAGTAIVVERYVGRLPGTLAASI